MKSFIRFFFLALITITTYEIGFDFLWPFLPVSRLLEGHGTWLFLHLAVPAMLVGCVSIAVGIWARGGGDNLRLFACLMALLLPPVTSVLNILFICFVLGSCI